MRTRSSHLILRSSAGATVVLGRHPVYPLHGGDWWGLDDSDVGGRASRAGEPARRGGGRFVGPRPCIPSLADPPGSNRVRRGLHPRGRPRLAAVHPAPGLPRRALRAVRLLAPRRIPPGARRLPRHRLPRTPARLRRHYRAPRTGRPIDRERASTGQRRGVGAHVAVGRQPARRWLPRRPARSRSVDRRDSGGQLATGRWLSAAPRRPASTGPSRPGTGAPRAPRAVRADDDEQSRPAARRRPPPVRARPAPRPPRLPPRALGPPASPPPPPP